MRRFSAILIVAVSVMALTKVASAADLPTKVPAPPVPATYNWYGFYIGLQGGYGWGGKAINLTPDANYAPVAAAGVFPLSLAADPRGVLGGIQYGSNFQFGHVVLGTASDFSFSDIKASQTSFSTVVPGVTTLGKQKLEWLSTTRARVGYTVMDNLLLYGTGGLANGRASASSSITLTGCPASVIVRPAVTRRRCGGGPLAAGWSTPWATGRRTSNIFTTISAS